MDSSKPNDNIKELHSYQGLLSSTGIERNRADAQNEELKMSPLIWWDVKTLLDQPAIGYEQMGTYAVLGQVLLSSGVDDSVNEIFVKADDCISAYNSAPVVEGNCPTDLSDRISLDADPSSSDTPDSGSSDSELAKKSNLKPPTIGEFSRPVLLNTNTPWSAFLCGSQGSGKSYTLSCMLENCLLRDKKIGRNTNALAGLVFHYDRSQGNDVCEAAYLCSSIPTKVLVSRSNYLKLKKKYEDLAARCHGNIEVKALDLRNSHLDMERMKSLMAIGKESELPLYMNVVMHILREMAIENGGKDSIDYPGFTSRLMNSGFTDGQMGPLGLRLDLLESYVDVKPRPKLNPSKNSKSAPKAMPQAKYKHRQEQDSPDPLEGKVGTLTIIDLTDPLVDSDSACALFDICLSIFLSQTSCGKIIVLDEAHNFMSDDSAAAAQFTGRLLKSIREQRHLGARVVIATQEPSIDPRLLDLCNITMMHRCTSPAWYAVLKGHIAALKGKDEQEVFDQIVRLRTGESLLFCPTAAIGLAVGQIQRMDTGYVKFRTRKRITADGGRSKLADGR